MSESLPVASLDGKVALVTGAGRGIGREAALALSALGAYVVIAEISADSALETETRIRERGGRAVSYPVDVSDPSAMAAVKHRHAQVDIVVNNAVVFYAKPLVEYTLEEWDRVVAVNLRAAFLAAKFFVPEMVRRGHGVFVTMQSGDGMPYLAPYFATKVALRSLASSLAQEVGAGSGVSVFCFGAGMVDTPAIREAVPQLAPLYGLTEAAFIAQSAPGGVLMSAEECAAGLAGCVLHAADLHGQEPAAVTGLALMGVGNGQWKHEDAGHAVDASPSCANLTELIGGLRREIEGLGLFQRQWYRRTLKQRSGHTLEEWETIARAAGESPNRPAVDAAEIDRLAAYFTALETDARGFIRNPRELEQALAALEARRIGAEKIAASLR